MVFLVTGVGLLGCLVVALGVLNNVDRYIFDMQFYLETQHYL